MQEIIVYRNPLEAALWGSLRDGAIVPVITTAFIFFVIFLSTHYVCEKIWKGWHHGQRNAIISFSVAIPAAVATMYFMS